VRKAHGRLVKRAFINVPWECTAFQPSKEVYLLGGGIYWGVIIVIEGVGYPKSPHHTVPVIWSLAACPNCCQLACTVPEGRTSWGLDVDLCRGVQTPLCQLNQLLNQLNQLFQSTELCPESLLLLRRHKHSFIWIRGKVGRTAQLGVVPRVH